MTSGGPFPPELFYDSWSYYFRGQTAKFSDCSTKTKEFPCIFFSFMWLQLFSSLSSISLESYHAGLINWKFSSRGEVLWEMELSWQVRQHPVSLNFNSQESRREPGSQMVIPAAHAHLWGSIGTISSGRNMGSLHCGWLCASTSELTPQQSHSCFTLACKSQPRSMVRPQ